MKNSYKAILLVALGFTAGTAAQAQTSDMLLGFNDPNGPTAAQNDYVIDIGAPSTFTVNTPTTVLTTTFNVSSFNTAFGADSSALNEVNVGAVEGYSGGYPKTIFETGSPLVPSSSQFNNAVSAAQGSPLGVGSSSASGSWTAEIATINASRGDVGQTLVNGDASMTLWEISRTSSSGSSIGTWTDIGTLAIDANADTISFTGADVSAVPEPASYALIGAAGLLLFSLRNKFGRNQA